VLHLRSAESSPSRKMILSGDQTASHIGRSGPSQRSSSAQPCKRSQSSSSGYAESGAGRRDVPAGDMQAAGDTYTARTGSDGRARNGNGNCLNNFRESEIKLSRQLIEQQHDDPRDAVSRDASGMFSGRHAEPGHQELRRLPPPSLYFRSQIANFGSISVGTNSRLQIELCNSSNDEVYRALMLLLRCKLLQSHAIQRLFMLTVLLKLSYYQLLDIMTLQSSPSITTNFKCEILIPFSNSHYLLLL
jgi:hypothetical protein